MGRESQGGKRGARDIDSRRGAARNGCGSALKVLLADEATDPCGLAVGHIHFVVTNNRGGRGSLGTGQLGQESRSQNDGERVEFHGLVVAGWSYKGNFGNSNGLFRGLEGFFSFWAIFFAGERPLRGKSSSRLLI